MPLVSPAARLASPPHRSACATRANSGSSLPSARAAQGLACALPANRPSFRRPPPHHPSSSLFAMADPADPNPAKMAVKDAAPAGEKDFISYFCTYSYLYHQKDMLEDHRRTGAYYRAVRNNARQFKDKVVLDVGTGSGILALFAAQAGARRVYAVEATSMARHARALVEANGAGDVVQVIQGTIETAELPEKVDIIISEWMGYFLLRESMLDSVLLARDRWLKPGGALYPSHARMLLAPCRTPQTAQRASDFHGAMEGWGEFAGDMARLYGVDLRCLSESYREEQREYFLRTAAWADVHPSQMMGPGVALRVTGAGAKAGAADGGAANGNGNGAANAAASSSDSSEELDLLTLQVGQLQGVLEADATLRFTEPGKAEGLVGWFDVSFRGSPENPADDPVVLTTEPDADGATHWGQQLFHVYPPLQVVAGEAARVSMRLSRREDNHRLLKVQFVLQPATPSGGGGGGAAGAGGAAPSMPPGAARTLEYQIE